MVGCLRYGRLDWGMSKIQNLPPFLRDPIFLPAYQLASLITDNI
jgi:hypothetical protein